MIRDDGHPAGLPSPDGSPEAREETWMWLYCQSRGANFPMENFRGISMMRNIEWFAAQDGGMTSLREQMELGLVPAECLNWIIDDRRQNNWLLSRVALLQLVPMVIMPPALAGRSLVIARLDIWREQQISKLSFIQQLEREWNQQKQSDRIFAWFQQEDEISRCELAWNWLLVKKEFPLSWQPPISNYEELLILFDNLRRNGSRLSDAEKTQIVDAIKKRWSQQKYRKNNAGKKQINMLLSDKTVKSLEKLAARYGVSNRQIVEVLIQYETERNAYLPDKERVVAAWNQNQLPP